jgi:hypothetical protein
MKKLLIIPAYNEEQNIDRVLDDINEHLKGFDILIVDDGSTDSTRELAIKRGVNVVSLPYNLGIGAAVQTGYIYAEREGYELAVQFDSDGQHRADQVERLIEPLLKDEADMVVGSRFLVKKGYQSGWTRMVGIRILSLVISVLIGQRITDPTSGCRAVNRKVIEFFSHLYPDDYPEPEALVLLHRAGFRITEVPVLMRQRHMGRSTITAPRAVYYMLKVLLAIFIDMLKRVPKIKS